MSVPLLALLGLIAAQSADVEPERAAPVHLEQALELERARAAAPAALGEDAREAALLGSTAPPTGFARASAPASGALRDDAIVFGYIQNEAVVFHLRWHALTHVGSRFVNFDAAGNLTNLSAFTGRSSYLKAGGAAEAAGTKVVLVLANFSDGNNGTIAAVMTSPAARANLVNQLVATLAADSYSHGVSLDLEFSWGPAVRDGITAFCQELRAAFDAVDPSLEISTYVGAIHSANQWDFDAVTGLTPVVDYVLYSMYDWATGSTARAISDFDNCLASGRMYDYLDAGLPPEKLVPVISSYSRRWNGVSTYGASGSSPVSGGFTDGHFDTTLHPLIGPGAYRYVRGDEAAWYTWNDGTQRVRTFDSLESMAVKVGNAIAANDPSGTYAGRRLGGVGFWSLMWLAEQSSVDPRTGATVSRTRTYPHVYQLLQDAFARPGEPRRELETFAGLDFRWRDPNESPDTRGDTDGDSARSLVAEPPTAGGRGRGMRFAFDFEGSTGNRALFAHEVLAHPSFPTLRDTNAVLGHVPLDTVLSFTARNEVARPGYRARLVVIDALRQLEASPALDLGSVGETRLDWRLNDPTLASPYATQEPGFFGGNGVVNTEGGADIGVFGIVIEGDGVADGALVVDDIFYAPATPIVGRYVINEVRIDDPALEFVEILGPAGPLPFGLVLRTLDPADGSVDQSFGLFGSIADAGRGRGYYVVGDLAVPNVDASGGFGSASDDLPNTFPGAIQLYDAVNDVVLDSVLYGGFGGPGDLVRIQTQGAAAHGPPWIGRIGPGRDASTVPYAVGRVPDGRDTRVNGVDFAAVVATPGESNRAAALDLPASIDFESPPPGALITFDAFRRIAPGLAGLPASPDGGLAWRVVDVAGGGVVGYVGDPWLGGGRGLRAKIQVLVPSPIAAAQAIGVGVGGGTAATFFSGGPATSGYESGLWLVYENRAGVGLADGRPDHPGVWELLLASNDNGDGQPAVLIASKGDGDLGVTPGTWVDVEFELLPEGAPGDELVVRVAGGVVYAGPAPAGAPRRGALQFGFRENHPGGPAPDEGLWVDGIEVDHAVRAVESGGVVPR